MAEGYSYIPDEDTTDTKVESVGSKKSDSMDRFKLFIGELFRPKDKKDDDEEDDDTPESTAKKGRSASAWQRLFRGSVVQKEDVTETGTKAAASESKGMFFEREPVDSESEPDQEPEYSDNYVEQKTPQEHIPDQEPNVRMDDGYEGLLTINRTKEVIATVPEQTEPAPDEVAYEDEQTAMAQEVPEPESEIPPVEYIDRQNQQAATAQEEQRRYYNAGPSSTYAIRHQLERTQQQETSLEREVKKVRKELEHSRPEKSVPTTEVGRPNAAEIPPKEAAPLRSEVQRPVQTKIERSPQQTETVRPLRPELVREVTKQVIEKAPDITAEKTDTLETKSFDKKSFEKEKIYNVSKDVQNVVDKLEVGESKEIAYELSHEHKDMDKQSASAWATLQATADAQAKANAAAVAAAQRAVGDQVDVLNEVTKEHQQTMYKQAAMGGFVTAVIIIAIIIVLLLVK